MLRCLRFAFLVRYFKHASPVAKRIAGKFRYGCGQNRRVDGRNTAKSDAVFSSVTAPQWPIAEQPLARLRRWSDVPWAQPLYRHQPRSEQQWIVLHVANQEQGCSSRSISSVIAPSSSSCRSGCARIQSMTAQESMPDLDSEDAPSIQLAERRGTHGSATALRHSEI